MKFEYKVLDLYYDFGKNINDRSTIQRHMNELGKQGWELVAISDSTLFFKRTVN